MCWNQSVSLNTFIFGLFAVAFALFNKTISLLTAIGFMSFISMQLVEYFAWGNITNESILAYLSMAGFALIALQPVLINLEELLSTGILNIFMGLYVTFLVLTFGIFHPLMDVNFSMHKAKNGHLAWDWLDISPIFVIILLGFYTIPKIYAADYLPALFAIVTVLTSYILYVQTNTWGSMWCWIVNILSVYLIVKVFAKELC